MLSVRTTIELRDQIASRNDGKALAYSAQARRLYVQTEIFSPAFHQDTTWSGCGSPTAMADLDQLVF